MERPMHAEHTLESRQLDLPQDLLMEVNRKGVKPKTDFRVEGWKPSLLGRLVEKLIGRDGR